MKIRYCFVTNSSSVSFVLKKSDLTDLQIEQIRDHIKHGNSILNLPITYVDSTTDVPSPYDYADGYSIEETDELISGHIDCDWFPMDDFLEKIGVKEELIEWENDTDHWDRYPKHKDYDKMTRWRI
jgi:hypothetical protein